jgi:hypothetical protein
MIEKLTNTEKIVSLLDGELGAQESKEFYNELSQNESLQTQMSEFIEINKMVRATRPVLPSTLKQVVISATGAGNSIFTTTTALTSYIATFITSAVLYFAIFSSNEVTNPDLLISEKSSKMTEQITTNNNSDLVVINNLNKATNKNIKATNTSGYSSEINNSNNNNKTLISETSSLAVDESSNFSENIIKNIDQKTIPTLVNSQIVSNTLKNIPLISDIINFENLLSLPTFERTNGESFLGNLNYGLRYNGLSSGNTYPNNFAISISSNVSDRWEVGVIGGLENIIQKFDFSNDIETRIYEQNYNAAWAGVTGKYTIYEIFKDSYFYGKGTAGFIKTGPLARAEIGLQYELMNGLRIYTGYEAMMTGYSFKGKWFNSEKYGLTFGLDFNVGVLK